MSPWSFQPNGGGLRVLGGASEQQGAVAGGCFPTGSGHHSVGVPAWGSLRGRAVTACGL